MQINLWPALWFRISKEWHAQFLEHYQHGVYSLLKKLSISPQ